MYSWMICGTGYGHHNVVLGAIGGRHCRRVGDVLSGCKALNGGLSVVCCKLPAAIFIDSEGAILPCDRFFLEEGFATISVCNA